MMLFVFILLLCSEVDVFIGVFLLLIFGIVLVMVFFLIGFMIDIKNLMMMVNFFKIRFIV